MSRDLLLELAALAWTEATHATHEFDRVNLSRIAADLAKRANETNDDERSRVDERAA